MAGVAIRRMTLDDRDAANSILSSAFNGLNPAGIVERELALAPHMCWIAVDELVAVGLVCAVEYGRVAYIGPMGVRREDQGKGIGRLLLGHVVRSLEERGCLTMMLDATEAGEPLYRKFGFVETARTFDMVREPGVGIVTPPGLDGLEHALMLDRAVFAADRGRTLRRLIEQERAALFTHSDGYLVSQTRVLGPFAAFTPDAAASLLDCALADGAVAGRVLAPVENREAERLLVSRGFEVEREVKHMRRGEPVSIRRDLIYGLASFALG
jgi:ribosomal protein S18 acetylase RimI-like enzyme